MVRLSAARVPQMLGVIAVCCVTAVSVLSCKKPNGPDRSKAALKLVSPNGGETFTVGEEIVIRWEANLDSVVGVDFQFSPDNGMTMFYINESTVRPEDPSWGTWRWTIPEEVGYSWGEKLSTVSEQCFLVVQEYQEGSGIKDFCDSTFSIVAQGM